MEPKSEREFSARDEFQEVGSEFLRRKLQLLSKDDVIALGQELERDGNWLLIIDLSEHLIGQNALPLELRAPYLMALRATNNSIAALQYIDSQVGAQIDSDFELQTYSILCELGDFETVVTKGQSHREQQASDQLVDILILRAWAHENCFGGANTVEAQSLYQTIVLQLNDQTPDQAASYFSPHPEARIGSHDFQLIRLLWAQRGHGNALSLLSKREDAEVQWARVVDRAVNAETTSQRDPYVQRIVAWCLFRLGSYDASLTAYRDTLDTGVAKYRPQLQQALVLYVMGRVSAAADQFDKAIYDLRDVDPVRRCGFLRSALAQFIAVASDAAFGSLPHAQEILDNLQRELDVALEALSKAVPHYVIRIRQSALHLIKEFASTFSQESAGEGRSFPIIEWSAVKIVGFEDPNEALCGTFSPVVDYEGERFACVIDPYENDGHGGPPRLESEPDSVKAYPATQLLSSTNRVLYFSRSAKDTLVKWSITSPLFSESARFGTDGGDEGMAICIESSIAMKELDRLALELSWNAFKVLTGLLPEPEPRLAEQSALFSFCAATHIQSMYQAYLIYCCLSDSPIDLRQLRRDKSSKGIPTLEHLLEHSRSLRALLEKVSYFDLVNLDPAAISSLADEAINRGLTISAIKDVDSRSKEAVWAASEMNLLLARRFSTISLQEQLADALPQSTMWYPPANLATLALAQEPAFYCAMGQSKLSKPTLDVFLFFRAPFISDQDGFEEGPIAARAKRKTKVS